jgi:DNA-binding NtrC family response regulator
MQTQKTLLIAEADPGVRAAIAALARELGRTPLAVSSAEEALEELKLERPAAVLMDRELPGLDGLSALKQMHAQEPDLHVILMGRSARPRAIVECMRAGASDFLPLPFEAASLQAALAPRTPAPSCGPEAFGGALFSGGSARMRALGRTVARVADTDLTVLIRGESGSGKDVVARWLWARSRRRGARFVKVCCAALPHQLLESELFGFEKGAFTGAEERRLGKFEQADGGTIFLDEISEIHPQLQAKLLQVLQDRQFSRLGGESDVHVDARVIAATNRDLEAAVRDAAFREDLYYRLKVVTIDIPPLRARRDEIEPLTQHLLTRCAAEYSRPVPQLTTELRDAFLAYHWPGNVRELENVLKRIVVTGSEEAALEELRARSCSPGDPPGDRPELERLLAGEVPTISLKRVGREAAQVAEARLIQKVLERTRWNRRAAAEILQVSYKALLYKMKDAGLTA